MKDILTAFPLPLIQLDHTAVTKKRRYGELVGLSKQVVERASEDPAKFEVVKNILVKQLAYMREDEEVNDPVYVKGKGRPRNKRLKNAVECRKYGPKCGRCGEEGHNARTCKHKASI